MSHLEVGDCDVPDCYICQGTSVYRTQGTLSIDMAELTRQAEEKAINHPPHYTQSSIEPIAVIEAWMLPFHLGCVVKYLCRYRSKGRVLEDLKKARWYLDRYIAMLEGKS